MKELPHDGGTILPMTGKFLSGEEFRRNLEDFKKRYEQMKAVRSKQPPAAIE